MVHACMHACVREPRTEAAGRGAGLRAGCCRRDRSRFPRREPVPKPAAVRSGPLPARPASAPDPNRCSVFDRIGPPPRSVNRSGRARPPPTGSDRRHVVTAAPFRTRRLPAPRPRLGRRGQNAARHRTAEVRKDRRSRGRYTRSTAPPARMTSTRPPPFAASRPERRGTALPPRFRRRGAVPRAGGGSASRPASGVAGEKRPHSGTCANRPVEP